MKKAIVTITVGEHYEKIFSEICLDNWKRYCNKYNFELIIIKNTLDHSERANNRSIAWQKLLILSQNWSNNYDQVVWIDSDIIINNITAPDITLGVPLEKVGAVEAYSCPSSSLHEVALKRLYYDWEKRGISYKNNLYPYDYYLNRGISKPVNEKVVQTGVLVCSPKYHKSIFEYVYYTYEDNYGSDGNYEMPALSFELVNSNLVHWLNPRFNFVVLKCLAVFYPKFKLNSTSLISTFINRFLKIEKYFNYHFQLYKLVNIYDLSYFMHFAGYLKAIHLLKNQIK